MKVYLDVCCLCRLFDDQSQFRVRIETDAVEEILALCYSRFSLISSTPIYYEVSRMNDNMRVQQIREILSRSSEYIRIDEKIVSRAKELAIFGIKNLDALHIACAERAHAVFLSTDDGIINTLKRPNHSIAIRIDNPVRWLEEVNEFL